DPERDAAFLKYRDLSSLPSLSLFDPERSVEQSTAAANAAALETLRKMGMAPSAEIDEAATKYRADPKYLEAKEIELAKIIGEHPNAKEIAKIIRELPNAKEIAKIFGELPKTIEIEEAEIIGELPKTKDEGEGP